MARKINSNYVFLDTSGFNNQFDSNVDTTQKAMEIIDEFSFYDRSEFISVSAGVSDAGKPIILNPNGEIDVSMLDTSTFYFVGTHDPSAGVEYPDVTGETQGAFWVVDVLTAPNDGDGYIFQAGDLTGKRITVGDFMVWGTGGWGIMVGEMNPLLYYRLDGTQAITAPFAGGNQQIKYIADGTEATDAVTLSQLQSVEAGIPATTDNLTEGSVNLYYTDARVSANPDVAANTSARHTHANMTALNVITDAGDGSLYLADDGTYKAVSGGSSSFLGLTDTPNDYTGSGQFFVKVNSTEDGLEFVAGSGVSVVWGDITGTLSNQTDLQAELDAKLNLSGGTVTGDLTVENIEPHLALIEDGTDTFSRLVIAGGSTYIQAGGAGYGNAQSSGNIIFSGLMGGNVIDFQVQRNNALHDIWHDENANFARLNDTPEYYTGYTGYMLAVNATEDGIEFVEVPEGTTIHNQLSGRSEPDAHPITSITDLQAALDAKANISDVFLTTDFINTSTGSADAGKPIILDANGQVDPSMISVSGLYPVGNFTPAAGAEYPDTTGHSHGAYWYVDGLSSPYTFTGGDLAGETTDNGDVMLWAYDGWVLRAAQDIDPNDYYRVDGTNALTAPLAGGGQQLKNIADGTAYTDAASVGQLNRLNADDVGAAWEHHGHTISSVENLWYELGRRAVLDADVSFRSIIVTNNVDALNFNGVALTTGGDGSLVLADNGNYVAFPTVPATTDDLPEGSSNLYYTEARVSANTDVAANTADRHNHANMAALNVVTDSGDGSLVLADNATYVALPTVITDHSGLSGRDAADSHPISAITDLQSSLDAKANVADIYLQTDFINASTGVSDAGKPIVLDHNGRIDVSMLDTSTFYYVGTHDPSAGVEYPDTTGETAGAFWVVDVLTAPNDGSNYIFQAGELAGKTITVGDFMVWGTGGWGIMAGEMNPLLYYKLDGTQAITAAFAGGNQQIKYIADGTDATDAVTLSQLQSVEAGIPASTDNLAEGSTNLYYTEGRVSANTDVAANTSARHTHANMTALDVITNTGDGSLYLADDGTYKAISGGVTTFLGLSDTPNDYTGQAGLVTAVNGTEDGLEFISLPAVPATTDDLAEGSTNLYYTEARVSANTDVAANTTHRGQTDNPHGVTAQQAGAPNISTEDELAGQMQIAVVTTLPATPDENTIYFITG